MGRPTPWVVVRHTYYQVIPVDALGVDGYNHGKTQQIDQGCLRLSDKTLYGIVLHISDNVCKQLCFENYQIGDKQQQ